MSAVHTVGRHGHAVHTVRTGRLVTVRGDALRVSPLRWSLPRAETLIGAAETLTEPGERLTLVTMTDTDRTNAHRQRIAVYLTTTTTTPNREATP